MDFKVNNNDLREELIEYQNNCKFGNPYQNKKGEWKRKIKKRGEITESLGLKIWTIANGLSQLGRWRSYTWREDMVEEAVMITLKYMHNYDPERYNAHGYINMICHRRFQFYVKREKEHHAKVKKQLYDMQDKVNVKDNVIDYEQLKPKFK